MSFSLEKAIFINRAPFEHLVLDFKEKGINVLSAINGNGKTTILSHITDAFYELAKKVFHNEFEGRENKYYRVSSSLYNLNLVNPSYVYLRFEYNGEHIDYVDIRNKCTEGQYNSVITLDSKIEFAQIYNTLSNSNNVKYWSLNDEKKTEDIFSNSVLTYFPSYRYETPSYLNEPYDIKLDYTIKSKFKGYLENQIEVVSDLPTLVNWFLDVLLDMKLKEETRWFQNGNKVLPITIPSAEKICVWDNLNKIVSSALSSKHYKGIVRLGIGARNSGSTRIAIMNDIPQKQSECICPSIFNLSAGELSLISIFGEILRQADNNHNNIQLNNIKGIVLIDEVDKHLHITLQKEILPKLFELFPNVQFIVSSHSPFLNMGLADTTVERSQIIDLDNNGITCSPTNNDLYKEVYDMMVGENNQFAKKYYQLEDTLKAIKKPLVITEGKTDIKFIQKAKEVLRLKDVDFEIITPDQQPDGDSNLQKMLEQFCKIKRPFPIIGIFDRDIENTVKKIDIGDGKYKDYGNRVYAFCIPIPKFREDREQTKISIEYLFSDEEIKSLVDEVGHRLFFGTEFTKHSMVHNECTNLTLSKPDGKGIDKILENNGGQAVYDEKDKNILAKKDDFANAVISDKIKINIKSWENFRPILEKIKKIIRYIIMLPFNEHALELSIMELFQQEGYIYTNGENIHKETSDVLLRDDMRMYLQNRYREVGITPLETENVLAKLTANDGFSLYDNNAQTYRLITEGFSLKRENTALPDLFIEPIDFSEEGKANNLFRIVNQLEIKGTEKRIPDGIVYINGLPMVVLEFKSAVKEETTIMDAYTQLTVRYRRDIPDLFKYNAFVVISDGVNNKYGSLFSPYDFFYTWRKVEANDKATDGINSLLTMVQGLFRKERLLSVIKDFVFFPDTSKNEKKVVCRYPQFFATHKLFENIRQHSKLQEGGDGKGGTYFGATGCGKSITMLFLSRMLMRSKDFASPTILLITDRTDLDDQLSKLFGTAKNFIGDDCVIEVESREKLREHLAGRTSGGVFLTTIHKFTEDTRLLSKRANIICISDEAHRSQTNLAMQVKQTETGVKRNYGFAKYLHDSLPNATYVGFTGTPIDATIEVFGEVVDTYTMTESVTDGITRRIVYEGRAAKVLLDNQKLKEIETYYKQCAEEGTNEYQIEESKKAVTKMERILGDNDRLQAVAEDFIAHYEKRVEEGSTVEGKAMLVCSNRTIAYNLYKKIASLRPEWIKIPDEEEQETSYLQAADAIALYGNKKFPIEKMKLIMTRNKDDEPELYKLLGTDDDRRSWAEEYKKPKSDFKIAIVVDMWTTGFDVDCLDTMYIDKPLQQHTLVQTISRVNRVYPGKEKGLVVDYIGIKSNMNVALKRYAQGDENADTVENVEQSVTMVKDELDIIRRMFGGFDYSIFSTGRPLEQLDCLNRGAELMQRTKEQENLFMGHAKKLKSAFNLCSNSEAISYAEREEIHYFCGVRSIIYKLTIGNTPDISQMNRRVSEMIEEAIMSEGVEEIIQIGNDKEHLDVLSEEYMERLGKLKLPNTKVKLMERLLNTVITEFKKVNKAKGVDFSKRLNALVDRYNERKDSAIFADEVLTEVASQMADLLKELNKEKRSFLDLGISYEEKAFYDILKSIAKQFGFEYPEDKLLKLAAEIKKIVADKSKYTDWSTRDDIKAELKMDLILILAEYGYPPVTNDEVFKEILEQAENFKKYN